MTMSFIAGKAGYVIKYDVTDNSSEELPMGEWRMPIKADFIKRNSFLARGYQTGVSGFKSANFTIKGPYALGMVPIVVGDFLQFLLGLDLDSGYDFSVFAHVTSINVSNNAEGAPELEIECDSVGEFQPHTV